MTTYPQQMLVPRGLIYGNAARCAVQQEVAAPLGGRADVAFFFMEQHGPNAAHMYPVQQARHLLGEGFSYYTRPRPSFAGMNMQKMNIMGIINMTPDSFSDGGRYIDFPRAQKAVDAMLAHGVDVIDIGGESTRPGAPFIPAEEEWARIADITRYALSHGARVSVDTRKAKVMSWAFDAGVEIINDVSALCFDPDALSVVAQRQAYVILMHHRGTPQTMQTLTDYKDIHQSLWDFFRQRLECCEAAGLPTSHVMLDPGLGFAKTAQQNFDILSRLSGYHGLGVPILLGASRKSMFKTLPFGAETEGRLPASLAAHQQAFEQAISMCRVHDWQEMIQTKAFLERMLGANAYAIEVRS